MGTEQAPTAPIVMRWNGNEFWPVDAPPGTFDVINEHLFCYICPNGKHCTVRVSGGPPPVWTWNGNREKPTLTPSINCVGCSHHTITDGVLRRDDR